MRGSTFQYDVVSTVGGQLIVSNSDVLSSDMTALDASTMPLKETTAWSINDIVLIRAITANGIEEEYLRITSIGTAVDSYSETNQNTYQAMSAADFVGAGQTFGTGSGGILFSCKFYLAKNGSPTGTAFAKIYALTGTPGTNAFPTGAALAVSAPFDVSTITTSFALVTFLFTGPNAITLPASTNYGVALEYSGGSAGNEIKIGRDTTVPTHSGNSFTNSGGGYGSQSGDFPFYVYSTQGSGYTVTRDLAGLYASNANPVWKKGSTVVKVGSSDGAAAYSGGWLRLIGEGLNAPYYSVYNRTGIAYNAYTEVLRTGNLNGYLDYTSSIFGFAVGSSSGTNANITIDPTNGIRIRNGTTSVISFDNSGNANISNTLTVGAALVVSTAGNIHSGQSAYNTGTGWWLEYNAATPRLSIGDSTTSNSLTWDGSTLKVNGSAISNNDIFGSGVDGAFALDATNTYATYFSKSGATYTQLMDVYATTITLSSNAIVITNGYRLFAKTSLTINSGSSIRWNGSNAGNASGQTGGTAGAALASVNLYGSIIAKAGGTGGATGGGAPTVNNGTAITNSFQTSFTDIGGTGGAGGGTGSGAQAAGTVGTISASSLRPYSSSVGVLMLDLADSATIKWLKYNGNAGGASGGQGGTNHAGVGGVGGGGGGNGSNGGTVVVCAKTISNAGTIQANGGTGGNGANGANGTGGPVGGAGGGGGGAGCGGAGGVVIAIYSTLSGAGTITASAGSSGTIGNGGTGLNGGETGSNGGTASTPTAGAVIQLIV